MQQIIRILVVLGCLATAGTLYAGGSSPDDKDRELPVDGLPPVYFCGESVPLHEEAVARRLVSALVRNAAHDQSLYRIRKRAASYFPIIEPILSKYQIPSDFKYLPLVESALRGQAVSPKGAVGYWQFMPQTARELGLSVRSGHDERRDLRKSTHAACRYLRYLHDKLGSWTLAAAAYNTGMGNLLSNIRRQRQRDYYYLQLNAETGRYLYRIIAFKELFSNYRCYGNYLPDNVLANLSRPLGQEPESDEEAVLSESFIEDVTRTAIAATRPAATQASSEDIPLPNAADVFRGGIKARLAEAADLKRGQIWVFHLTRSGLADGTDGEPQPVTEGDMLYAVVEDIDLKTGKLYLRADKLYSLSERATYGMSLAAVDASTGRIGIRLPDLDQMKAGWILTWKVL